MQAAHKKMQVTHESFGFSPIISKILLFFLPQRQWGTQWAREPGKQGQLNFFPLSYFFSPLFSGCFLNWFLICLHGSCCFVIHLKPEVVFILSFHNFYILSIISCFRWSLLVILTASSTAGATSECDKYIFEYICHEYLFGYSFVSIFLYEYIRFLDANIFRYSFVSKSYSGKVWQIFEYLNIRVIFDTNIHSYNICIVLFHTNTFGYSFISSSWYEYIQIYIFILKSIRMFLKSPVPAELLKCPCS